MIKMEQTSKERWESISEKTAAWLTDRINNIEAYELKIGKNEEEYGNGKCFFCSRDVAHINDGGNAWCATVNVNNKRFNVLYCNADKHEGIDQSEESEEAHNKALWYEEGDYDVIGFYGYKYNVLNNPYEN
jgi:hypothetical protein